MSHNSDLPKKVLSKPEPSNSKEFWKSVRYLNKQDSSIGTVIHEGHPCHTDLDKANAINAFFSKCFNQSVPSIVSLASSFATSSLLCTEDQIYKILRSLDTTKSTDGISALMLKNTTATIAPSVTLLFNCSIRCSCLPSEWKLSSVIHIPKNLELNNQVILDLYHSCQLLAKF